MSERSGPSGRAKRPNIVFFFTDDQRFDTIAALGNPEIRTPNLDALVAEGTAFTRAYIMGGTCGAVCMPSRAMLHSGRTLFRLDDMGRRIPPEHATLGETLRGAGYTTYHVGKWHQDRESFHRSWDGAARIFGFTPGWYEQYGGHWNVCVHDFDPTGEYPEDAGYILAADKETRLPRQAAVGGVHSSELFADAAIDFVRGRAGLDPKANPFFLYVSFVAPHDPRQSPNEFEEMYPASAVSTPDNFRPRHPFDNGEMTIRDEMLEAHPRRESAIRTHLGQYYAMISHADQQIGRVVQALKDAGLWEDTILVFSGDNGLAVGQHGLMGKQNVYEHSVHVPLVLAGPGIPRGERRDAMCYLLDLLPTLCGFAGADVPKSVEGRSLVPLLADSQARLRDTMYFAYRHVQRAVRDERYKLITYVVDGWRREQLFDLQDDPKEMRDLAFSCRHTDIRDLLRRELVRLREEYADARDRERPFWEGYQKG